MLTCSVQRHNPQVNFVPVWRSVHNKFVDSQCRDLACRVVHGILPVQTVLYKRGITRNVQCAFCYQPETVTHLFCQCPLIMDLWLYVEMLLSKMAQTHFSLTVNLMVFNYPHPALSKALSNMTLLLVNTMKMVIWKNRCLARFENKVVTNDSLLLAFKSHVKFRCQADFLQLPLIKF